MKALVISADPALRQQLTVALRSAERATGEAWETFEATNGLTGMRLAWREQPDIVLADEIASGAGGFAVAKDLRGSFDPFPGAIVLLLARRHDEWLARWSGADAWLVKPLDPFELADVVVRLLARRPAAREPA